MVIYIYRPSRSIYARVSKDKEEATHERGTIMCPDGFQEATGITIPLGRVLKIGLRKLGVESK